MSILTTNSKISPAFLSVLILVFADQHYGGEAALQPQGLEEKSKDLLVGPVVIRPSFWVEDTCNGYLMCQPG